MYYYSGNPYNTDRQKDNLEVRYDDFDLSVIDQIRSADKNIPLVSVLLAGRPMLIDDVIDKSQAMIHAFWPGTSGGQGIVDAVVGNYLMRPDGEKGRKNTLSFEWPRNMYQLVDFPIYKADGKVPKLDDPLYKIGYGLSTSKK